ncbi:MAG: hypothetical protein AB1489_07020 [Acidobacteriota bacterium]
MDDAERLNHVDQLLVTIEHRVDLLQLSLLRCPRNAVLQATLRTLRHQERLLLEARHAIIEAALKSIEETTLN